MAYKINQCIHKSIASWGITFRTIWKIIENWRPTPHELQCHARALDPFRMHTEVSLTIEYWLNYLRKNSSAYYFGKRNQKIISIKVFDSRVHTLLPLRCKDTKSSFMLRGKTLKARLIANAEATNGKWPLKKLTRIHQGFLKMVRLKPTPFSHWTIR